MEQKQSYTSLRVAYDPAGVEGQVRHSPDSDHRVLQEGVAVGKLHNFQCLFSIPFP